MNMPKISIVIGFLLVLVGIAGYAHAASEGKTAVTALIPSFFGLLFVVLGAASLAKPNLRKHLMHALAALALVGTLAAGGRFAAAVSQGTGSPVARAATASMAVLCAVTVALCVKSFRDARRARTLQA